jgi:hypothetical protein
MRTSPCLPAFVLAAGLLAAGVRPAAACECAESGESACQAFTRSEIVFVGDVLSVEETGRAFHMRLRVARALKGITAATADLWSDASTDCGVRLEKGKQYVIYTSLRDGRMSIYACGYGRELAPGEPGPQVPVPGSIYGRVVRYDIDRIRMFEPLEALASARIALDLPGGRVTATSDRWGRFQFTKVPPGTYPLAVNAGQGLTPWMAKPVVLADPDACVDTEIVLQPSGKVSGRLVTAGGRPAPGIYLRLLPDGPARSLLAQHVDLASTTDADGRFSFEGLGPDTYAIAVNPDPGDATGRQPYAPAFFGGADHARATRIRVAAGAAIELQRPFVLPAPLPTRTFTVTVSCRDGSVPPAVTAQAKTGGAMFAEFAREGGPVRTLTLVRDQAYTLNVSIAIPEGPARPQGRRRHEEKLPPMELPSGAAGRHIALTAPFTNCAEDAR